MAAPNPCVFFLIDLFSTIRMRNSNPIIEIILIGNKVTLNTDVNGTPAPTKAELTTIIMIKLLVFIEKCQSCN